MKTKTPILVVTVLGLVVLAAGCAKNVQTTEQQQQQRLANVAAQVLELPVPDGSYLAQTQNQIAPSGSNVQTMLTTIINPVAQGLKEMNMKLAQTVAQGTFSADGMTITDSQLKTKLSATVSGATISYTYTVNGTTYFTGTVQTNSLAGSLSFAASTSPVWSAFAVTFSSQGDTAGNLTRTIVVNSTSAGALTFSVFYPAGSASPSTVTMVGSGHLAGSWSATGGNFTDAAGTKHCFSSSLADVTGGTSGC
jgi:hypothetical protein